MKKKIVLVLCLFCSVAVFAESTTYSSITTAFTLGPLSENVPGDDHFSPPTKPGIDSSAFVQGTYGTIFPIALGDHPLVAGSHIKAQVDILLTPVTAAPRFDVSFAPLPFLSVNAGATIGAGWSFGNELLVGMSAYDKDKKEYTPISAFSSMYYDTYIQGNFQFDVAAIVPGDWNHIVTMATYKLAYTGITSGGENGNPWDWLTSGEENVNGLNYLTTVMIGYQMPFALQLVGLQASFGGYFFENDFDTQSYDWDPTFMEVILNAVAVVKIADNHTLSFLTAFMSRRSFDKEYADDVPIVDKKTIGREWLFAGIGISYTYAF